MIIISNKPGQLGNLLFIYAHFLAYGKENRISVINPSFYAYKSYFTSTAKFSLYRNKLIYSLCYGIARLLFRLNIKTRFINVIALDSHVETDLEKAKELKSTFCFVQGWLFRSEQLFAKHKETIRSFFLPETSLQTKLNHFFTKYFPDPSQTIIGIHIRRGDYKTFEDGKYYYSLEQYIDFIKQVNTLFKNNNPHFLICSNEKFDNLEDHCRGIKITFAPGHELLDMYALSRCHYIAGPPSTYSMWASFYGKVPLYVLNAMGKVPAKEEFTIYAD